VCDISAEISGLQQRGSEILSHEKSEKMGVLADSPYISVVPPCFYLPGNTGIPKNFSLKSPGEKIQKFIHAVFFPAFQTVFK
jgi:hypothetical protein